MPVTYDLPLNATEVGFLVNLLPTDAHYPEPYNSWAFKILPDSEVSGGPEFRLKLIALHQHLKRTGQITPLGTMFPLECTAGELWLLESALSMMDIRTVISTEPRITVISILERIWEGLIGAHANLVDERYLPLTGKALSSGMTADQKARLAELDRLI